MTQGKDSVVFVKICGVSLVPVHDGKICFLARSLASLHVPGRIPMVCEHVVKTTIAKPFTSRVYLPPFGSGSLFLALTFAGYDLKETEIPFEMHIPTFSVRPNVNWRAWGHCNVGGDRDSENLKSGLQ